MTTQPESFVLTATTTEIAAELRRLEAENARLREELQELRDAAYAFGKILIDTYIKAAIMETT